jgi:hypothetical protein
MRLYLFLISAGFISICTGQSIDSILQIPLPEGIMPSGILADMAFYSPSSIGKGYAGLKSGKQQLAVVAKGRHRQIEFVFDASAQMIKQGKGTVRRKNQLIWKLPSAMDSIRIWWSAAADSANNLSLLSAYCAGGDSQQVKFLATIKLPDWRVFYEKIILEFGGRFSKQANLTNACTWAQRANGTWVQLSGKKRPASPSMYLFNHMDSLAQAMAEQRAISKRLKANEQAVDFSEGIYYQILEKGKGAGINVTDTITVFYKGTLWEDGTLFDQTGEKPATFPLSRLIKGWQLALPKINVGGKIMVYLPSGMAYSIRTRSPKIPPNSILVFEIEVVDAKSINRH